MNIRFIGITFTVFALAACATPDPFKPVASNGIFTCDHGEQITLSLGDNSDVAVVKHYGRQITLQRIDDPRAEHVFKSNAYTLFVSENKSVIALEREGAPMLSNCRPFEDVY